jgi:signal transduction histidine kinase
MAVSPVAVTQERRHRLSDTVLWRGALALGLLCAAIYALMPSSWAVLRQLIVYPAGDLVGVASVFVGIRRYRPVVPQAWMFIGAGLGVILLGDVLWGLYEIADLDPFPSVADFFYLASYPLIATGLTIATVRRRPYGVDFRAAIDTAIVTVIGTLLVWLYIVRPVFDNNDASLYEQVVTVMYPIGDLLLFAVAARFVMGSSWNARALRMLVIGLAFTLIGDILFVLGETADWQERAWDVLLLIGVVTVGVAALDPSMRALTEEHGDPAARTARFRLVVVVATIMVPSVVMMIQDIRGAPLYIVANLAATILLVILVTVRFRLMTDEAQRAAAREAALSNYTAELLAGGDRQHLFNAARRTLTTISGATVDVRLVLDSETKILPAEVDFSVPIGFRAEHVGEIVARGSPARLRRWRPALTTVAVQLSMALERQHLLDVERDNAESLAAQNARLLELDAMKDSFVSSVSHELRTPLTSMVGYLEILRDGELGELTDEQEHAVEIIDRNCHRLDKLIGDILVTARLDSGRLTLDMAEVDVSHLATTHIESIKAVAGAKGVVLRLVVEEAPPPIRADPMRLGQVIDNLLSNAVKFTSAGGTVTCTIGRGDDLAWFAVTDTGVGMPPEDLDKVFDRFYRASSAGTTPGTGLGLSIAKSFVEAHDGTITVRSELGVGTTFQVELPLPAGDDEAALREHFEVTT